MKNQINVENHQNDDFEKSYENVNKAADQRIDEKFLKNPENFSNSNNIKEEVENKNKIVKEKNNFLSEHNCCKKSTTENEKPRSYGLLILFSTLFFSLGLDRLYLNKKCSGYIKACFNIIFGFAGSVSLIILYGGGDTFGVIGAAQIPLGLLIFAVILSILFIWTLIWDLYDILMNIFLGKNKINKNSELNHKEIKELIRDAVVEAARDGN